MVLTQSATFNRKITVTILKVVLKQWEPITECIHQSTVYTDSSVKSGSRYLPAPIGELATHVVLMWHTMSGSKASSFILDPLVTLKEGIVGLLNWSVHHFCP